MQQQGLHWLFIIHKILNVEKMNFSVIEKKFVWMDLLKRWIKQNTKLIQFVTSAVIHLNWM